MLRVCGADREQPKAAQQRCWCGGLFCGRGGGAKSKQFFKWRRNRTPAASVAHFEDLTRQMDLYLGAEQLEYWRGQVRQSAARAQGRPS